MSGSPTVLLFATLALTLLFAPALVIFFGGIPRRRTALVILASIPVTLVLASGEWLLLGSDLGVAIFQGAVAAASVCAVLVVGLRNGRVSGYLVFTGVWVVAVLVPVGFSAFDVRGGLLAAQVGMLDFGGASTVAICTATAALAITTISRPRGNAVGGVPRRSVAMLVFCAATGAIGWLALGTGAELVLDDTSLILVRNELLGATAGMAGWTLTQVINVRRATPAGVVAGLFAGSAVVLAALPWVSPLSAVVIGFGAGTLGHVTSATARSKGAGAWATLLGALGVPGALGLLATGVVAEPLGLIFSGHTELLVSQFAGVALVVAYSFVVALVLALIVDRVLGLVGSSRYVDESVMRLYRAYGSGDEDAVRGLVHSGMSWPEGWNWHAAGIPTRSRRRRDGGITVSFDGSETTHIYTERDGLFDRMELG